MLPVIVNIALVLFLIFWVGVAGWLVIKYEDVFGLHRDDPSETDGARTLNMTQVWSCWFGFFVLALYFLLS